MKIRKCSARYALAGLLATAAVYQLDRTITQARVSEVRVVLTGAQRCRGVELGLEQAEPCVDAAPLPGLASPAASPATSWLPMRTVTPRPAIACPSGRCRSRSGRRRG